MTVQFVHKIVNFRQQLHKISQGHKIQYAINGSTQCTRGAI